MKIVIAPDSFKESLTSRQVADSIENGFRKIFPEATYMKIPMADGGEGTVDSLVHATGGKIVNKTVTGPLGNPVKSFFGLLGNGETAVIEMASASGLHLVPFEKRNPLITTSVGTGELMVAALDYGVNHIIIGIGGSATNDGGAGMAKALGIKLLNKDGREIGNGGGSLKDLYEIDLTGMDQRLKHVKIEVACDVDNPLTGDKGASVIFGPQKGATAKMISELDANLCHYASIIQKKLGKDVNGVPGAGAAGGLGAGLIAFLNAELKSGIDIVLEATQFKEVVRGATLVITGEGKIDHQTIYGKTPIGVARVSKSHGVPVIAIAGNVTNDSDIVYEYGIDALFSIVPGITNKEDAFSNASKYIERLSRDIASLMKLSNTL